MRKVLAIALNDLRIILKERGIFLNLVVIPVGIALAVGIANGASLGGPAAAPDVIVDVIDGDQSARSAAFLDDLRAANTSLLLCPMDNTAGDPCGLGGAALDEALAAERVRAQRSLALILIPAGFGEALAAGEPVELVYRSNEDASAPSYIQQALQTVTQRWSAALVAARVGAEIVSGVTGADGAAGDDVRAALYERAERIWAGEPVRIVYVEAPVSEGASSGGEGFSQSIPGIGTMYVMFAVFPALSAFLQERRNWTFQRLVMMPVSRAQIVGGKLLARFAFGMIQYGVLFGFGYLLGIRYGDDPVALILIMVSYVACITALTLALLTFVRSEGQAEGLSLFLTLTLAPLGGAWWPLEIVPSWMRTLGHLSPVAWAMDGFRSLIFYGGSLSTVLVPIGVLLAATAVLFLIGVARFRYE